MFSQTSSPLYVNFKNVISFIYIIVNLVSFPSWGQSIPKTIPNQEIIKPKNTKFFSLQSRVTH
jgi:hypothetical protein